MNSLSVPQILTSRYALAIASGLLLACAFPKIGIAGLGWIAPGCILFCALGCSGREAFRVGYVAGLAHYLTSLYWLLLIPFPMGAVAGWLALSSYLALFPALWVWFCWKLFPAAQYEKNGADPLALPKWFVSVPLYQRTAWFIGCAAAWVTWEMVVARLFTGFPWNLLSASQYKMAPLIQIASITGAYGLAFLMVWFSVSLGSGFLHMIAKPDGSRAWMLNILLPLGCAGLTVMYGLKRVSEMTDNGPTIRAALIQPSIPQTLIWDPKESTNRFNQLIVLSEKALSNKVDLLVWPEAAVPNLLRWDPTTAKSVAGLAQKYGVPMIIGADDAEPRRDTPDPDDVDFYNSSFLISSRGKIQAEYRKRRLVAFGEYIPLVRWLPFLKHFIPVGQGFTPGTGPSPFELPELGLKASVLICFEDIFANLSRGYVDPDTDILLNLTNNGWFGESAAQWQHAANAVFRAVELNIPLVRCANNGLTCWVDSRGRLHEVYFEGSKDIYQAGFKLVQIPLLPEGTVREATIYRRYGDWFGWGCVILTASRGLGLAFRRRSKALQPELEEPAVVANDEKI